MALTVQESKKIAADLTAAGLNVNVNRPVDEEGANFEIEIDTTQKDGRINMWPGAVDVKVFPSKKHRQAVLWADEKRRTITRDVQSFVGSYMFGPEKATQLKAEVGQRIARWTMGRDFPISLPEETTYTMVGTPTQGNRPNGTSDYLVAKVKAVVPATRLTFLIGRDEHSHFVSVLPKRVDNVPDAHTALRPRSVPEGSPRQGEWFFVPATEAEKDRLEKLAAEPSNVIRSWLGSTRMYNREGDSYDPFDPTHDEEEETSHAALTSIWVHPKRRTRKDDQGRRSIVSSRRDPQLFVVGYIVDDRSLEGNPSRHDPLWLPDWHKVVRNLEIQMPGQNESWD